MAGAGAAARRFGERRLTISKRLMGKVAIAVAVLVAAALALVAGGIAANRPPLSRPPGALERIKRYLTANVAETGQDARLEELGPVWLEGTPQALLAAVEEAMREQGWEAVRSDADAATVRGEVVSALFRFTDDVQVRLVASGDGRSEARIRSASRVGRGDLGANARHVMDLVAALHRRGLVLVR